MKPDINNPVVERTFIRWHIKVPQNYPGPSIEISLGDLPGGTIWIKWVHLERWNPWPALSIHNDAWELIPHFKDLFDMLAEIGNRDITEPEFCKMLKELGIVERI